MTKSELNANLGVCNKCVSRQLAMTMAKCV